MAPPLRKLHIVGDIPHLQCTKCKLILSLDKFSPANNSRGRTSWCKECYRKYSADRARQLPADAFREINWISSIEIRGISTEQYRWLDLGHCWNDACLTTDPGGRGRWNIDHDHSHCDICQKVGYACGASVRGLLCKGCNTGDGITDSIPLMLGKIRYLQTGYVVFPPELPDVAESRAIRKHAKRLLREAAAQIPTLEGAA